MAVQELPILHKEGVIEWKRVRDEPLGSLSVRFWDKWSKRRALTRIKLGVLTRTGEGRAMVSGVRAGLRENWTVRLGCVVLRQEHVVVLRNRVSCYDRVLKDPPGCCTGKLFSKSHFLWEIVDLIKPQSSLYICEQWYSLAAMRMYASKGTNHIHTVFAYLY